MSLHPTNSPPPPQHSLREPEEVTTEVGYTQIQVILEWLFLSIPTHRSFDTLPTLHHTTLSHGLATLRQRIADLADLDLKLYHKYRSLLSDKEYAENAVTYTGWCWFSPPDSTLEMVSREELEKLLWQEVSVYDEIAKSVRMWKKEVDESVGKGREERRERLPWEVLANYSSRPYRQAITI